MSQHEDYEPKEVRGWHLVLVVFLLAGAAWAIVIELARVLIRYAVFLFSARG